MEARLHELVIQTEDTLETVLCLERRTAGRCCGTATRFRATTWPGTESI